MQRFNRTSRSATPALRWYRMDLHLHTPASSDYHQPTASYLDLLRQAEARGLDMIAFTDHNTVAGYRQLQDEIEQLALLERLGRMQPDEADRLREYRRLLDKILILPGFEFTATFGFHILGIFSPDTSVRVIEHVLLDLNVPDEQLDKGSVTIGASADVLTAYRTIREAGGLVIAAHVNSANGVAMRNFPFGGQTKIAYTQDANLHALEVTDLEQGGRRGTQAFFNGSKPEYPRRMHCIQGSDAHRVTRDSANPKNLGIGDRVTEVQLDVLSFEELKALFESDDFSRTRPYRGSGEAVDFIQMAREEGSSIVQAFHESYSKRGGHLQRIVNDVCAMANTNGGTIYVGVSSDPKAKPRGVTNAPQVIAEIQGEIGRQITPGVPARIDSLETQGKVVVRVSVPRGGDVPYAIGDNQVFIRNENDTETAVRDEIVQLVLRGQGFADIAATFDTTDDLPEAPAGIAEPAVSPAAPSPVPVALPPRPEVRHGKVETPRTGVEIADVGERDGVAVYTMRDLRNGTEVKNVTRASARKLWLYAIQEHEKAGGKHDIVWQGALGLVKSYRRGRGHRYDLALREGRELRIFYGVTDDGVHGPWQKIVGADENNNGQE